MLEHIDSSKIIFLDIETVPQYSSYLDVPIGLRSLWDVKANNISKQKSPFQLYERAGIYAEFGKIICISMGYFTGGKQQTKLRLKSFYNHDEAILLTAFSEVINDFIRNGKTLMCAHNGKEFDFPYIARRLLANQITLPDIFKMHGKKPWEIPHLDTMELWRFGDFKHYTSLKLLCQVLQIPTPKDDIDGSMVAKIYWKDGDLERIKNYCQKDVVAVAQLFRRYLNLPLMANNNIELAD